MSSPYRTIPENTTKMPAGVPFIVGNEAAERFSFYGMRAILMVFMTKYLMDANGSLAPMSDEDAKVWFHLFCSAVYFFPIVGAIIADWLFGKYPIIIGLSIVYCLGHLALALDETRLGLGIGLALIAVGAGGIKPCVSAHVGDQFGPGNQHLLSKVFSWFYFSINLGAFFSTMLTPYLLDQVGPTWAFGVPGILMLIATITFWLGRHRFVHIPPGGSGFFKEAFGKEGMQAIRNLVPLYLFVAMFWALFDQTGSAWILQAQDMDRNLLGREWLPSQIHAVNPILILLYIPLFTYVIYPVLQKFIVLTPLRRIGIGFFITVGSFAIAALAQARIDQGLTPSVMWQVAAYMVITAGEVMVSITCLEFSYTQAPKRMKSLIMGCYQLSVTLGNLFTSAVNKAISTSDGTSRLSGADYYWFFALVMLVTAVGFVVFSQFYRGATYIQDAEEA